MPGGDGTGPAGMGPMTGRAAGYCAGYAVPGFMNPIPGRGMGGGRGMGWGRGRGWGWQAAYGRPPAGAQGAYAAGAYAPGAYGPQPPYGAAAYTPPMSQEAELDALRAQADYFTSALEEIRKRTEELESAQQEK